MVKKIAAGITLYIVFAAAVIKFYPDEHEDMNWEDRQEYNNVQVKKLDIGIEHQAIIELMGSPDISEAKWSDEDKYQVMYYRTHHVRSDGITTKSECTPLLLKNNQLIAWGDGAIEMYEKS